MSIDRRGGVYFPMTEQRFLSKAGVGAPTEELQPMFTLVRDDDWNERDAAAARRRWWMEIAREGAWRAASRGSAS
jgi:hypothetical protein